MLTQTIERLAYSPQEAAASVGLSVSTIYNLVKSGKLKAFKCEGGRKILIPANNLRSFINQETERRKGFLERITGIEK